MTRSKSSAFTRAGDHTFHFREGNANWLTNPVYDPDTLTAEYKACAVALEKIGINGESGYISDQMQ